MPHAAILSPTAGQPRSMLLPLPMWQVTPADEVKFVLLVAQVRAQLSCSLADKEL